MCQLAVVGWRCECDAAAGFESAFAVGAEPEHAAAEHDRHGFVQRGSFDVFDDEGAAPAGEGVADWADQVWVFFGGPGGW